MIEADEKNLEGQAGDGMVKISKEETGKRIRRLLAESGITVRDVQEELEPVSYTHLTLPTIRLV